MYCFPGVPYAIFVILFFSSFSVFNSFTNTKFNLHVVTPFPGIASLHDSMLHVTNFDFHFLTHHLIHLPRRTLPPQQAVQYPNNTDAPSSLET